MAGIGNGVHARQRRGASPLVGRDSERAILSELLHAASEGRGRVGLVVGEAGIGKSRLLDALAAEAVDRGMVVLRGRAVEATTPVAYRPAAEALCSLVRTGRAPARADLTPFDHLLGALIPDWRDAVAPVVEPSVVVVAEAVVRFLRAAAGSAGCLLVLEDLHWSDPETLSILEYLADNLVYERVLCAASWRTDEPRTLGASLGQHTSRAAETLVLERLDESAVSAMVASCLDAQSVDDDVLTLVGTAEGVPFLVEEVLDMARSTHVLTSDGHRWSVSSTAAVVPRPFVDDVRRRLVDVGGDGRTVVVAGALLGRRFEWDLLPAIAGLDDAATVAALRDAIDLRLIEVDDDPSTFRFRHALSRDAVLSDVLPPERAELARRAVAAIEAARPDLDDEWCGRAAALAVEAGDRQRAPMLLLEAGRRALVAGALLTAEAALERGSEMAHRDDPIMADIEECLVETEASIGNRERAEHVGRSLLRRLGDGADYASRRAGVELRLARASITASRWDEAETHVGAARTAAGGTEDERQLSEADALDALIALGRDHPGEAVRLARQAHVAALHTGLPRVACEALEVIGRCARVADLDAAERAFSESLDIAERERLTVWRLRAMHELGTIDMLRSGNFGRLEAARDLASSTGALATGAMIDVQLCGVLVGRDDPEPAVAVARRAGDIVRRLALSQTLAVALGFEANAHARAGRPAAAERCLAEAVTHAGDDPSVHVFAACARATALLDDDRVAALTHVEGVAHDARFFSPLIGWWVLLHALDPQRGEAAVLAVRDAGEPAHYLARPYYAYAQAVVLGRAGERHEAAAKVTEADALLEGFEWYRQDGRRFVAEAALADGWGDPVGWAREALAFFESWGHDRLAGSCRTLLRQAGAPVPRRGRGSAEVPAQLGALGVTSREVDVLALVAAGMSNREVAERLVLSVRTVENHVERLLAKTASPGRAALVDVAARTGVTNEGLESL